MKTEDRSPCSGCFYEQEQKKSGHCEQCSYPGEYADRVHIEDAISAIDYASPLVIIGEDVYSSALLFPKGLGI